MIIEESDFKLIPISDDCPRFDLELLYTINKGKDNERKEFKNNDNYGLTLSGALKRIAHYRVVNNNPESITIKKYLTEYKTILEDLEKLCGMI